MGFYSLDLDELSKYKGIEIKELKNKSYAELESMINIMNYEKIMERNGQNAEDKPCAFLRHWWNDREIVLACADTGTTIGDICREEYVKPGTGRAFWEKYGEYLRTSEEYVRQYDSQGREYLNSARETVDVYRTANDYQSTCQGNVIRHLLYKRYPKLAKFNFKMYGFSGGREDYEIYPDSHVYTSFTAIMTGDVDWIIHRNREYCKSYNNGRYSPEECEKAFRTKEVLEMFDVIRSIGEQEKAAGRFSVSKDEDGRLIMPNGLKETAVSGSGSIKLMQRMEQGIPGKVPFKLKPDIPYSVVSLVNTFLSMIGNGELDLHVYHIMDHLGEHGDHVTAIKEHFKFGWDTIRCPGFKVCDTFGWRQGNKYDLTIRIDCPEMMEE